MQSPGMIRTAGETCKPGTDNFGALTLQRRQIRLYSVRSKPVGGVCAGSGGANAKSASQNRADNSELGPIDRALLARFTLNNAALEREVLLLFAEQAPLYLKRLRAAATSKAWKEAAHSLKGAAAAVGARRVASFAEMAERLDFDARAVHDEGHREQAVAAVAAAVDEACGFIQRVFTIT
jgi:HPt (histidine-containing phosphotransfer) domain-containing protein